MFHRHTLWTVKDHLHWFNLDGKFFARCLINLELYYKPNKYRISHVAQVYVVKCFWCLNISDFPNQSSMYYVLQKLFVVKSKHFFSVLLTFFLTYLFFLTDIQLSLHQQQQSCTNRAKRTQVKKPLHNSHLNYQQIEVANNFLLSCKSSTAFLRWCSNLFIRLSGLSISLSFKFNSMFWIVYKTQLSTFYTIYSISLFLFLLLAILRKDEVSIDDDEPSTSLRSQDNRFSVTELSSFYFTLILMLLSTSFWKTGFLLSGKSHE